jgi:hypothetical protein
MRAILLTVLVLMSLGLSGLVAAGPWETVNYSDLHFEQQRQLLLGLKRGTTSAQVLNRIGKPDEVYRISDRESRLTLPFYEDATECWVYGAMAPGMFARVGHVGLRSDGTVAYALAPAGLSRPFGMRPEQNPTKFDQSVETSSKLSCHIGTIYPVTGGRWPDGIKTKVTLKNAGVKVFQLSHDETTTVDMLFFVQIYDKRGALLSCFCEMTYHSPSSFRSPIWPVFSIAPGTEWSEELEFGTLGEFGKLPPGKYFVRLFFPLEPETYYPSNLVGFEVKNVSRKS